MLSITSFGQRARRRNTQYRVQPGVMLLAALPAAVDRIIGVEKHGYGTTCIEGRSQRLMTDICQDRRAGHQVTGRDGRHDPKRLLATALA